MEALIKAIPQFEVIESVCHGSTLEFMVIEMKCKGIAGSDIPAMGLKAGDILNWIGASLFWWKWATSSIWSPFREAV